MYEELQQTQTNQWPESSNRIRASRDFWVSQAEIWGVVVCVICEMRHTPSSNETTFYDRINVVNKFVLLCCGSHKLQEKVKISQTCKIWFGAISLRLKRNNNRTKLQWKDGPWQCRPQLKHVWHIVSKLATVPAWRSSARISHFLQSPIKFMTEYLTGKSNWRQHWFVVCEVVGRDLPCCMLGYLNLQCGPSVSLWQEKHFFLTCVCKVYGSLKLANQSVTLQV